MKYLYTVFFSFFVLSFLVRPLSGLAQCSTPVSPNLSGISYANPNITNQQIGSTATTFSSTVNMGTSTTTGRPTGSASGDLMMGGNTNGQYMEYVFTFSQPVSIQLSQGTGGPWFDNVETWNISTNGPALTVNAPAITYSNIVNNASELSSSTGTGTNLDPVSFVPTANNGHVPIANSQWTITGTGITSLKIKYTAQSTLGANSGVVRLAVCAAATLPVNLLTFDAKIQGAGVVLNWIAASEKNNAFYEVERSQDQKSWQLVERVASRAVAGSHNAYQVTDPAPLAGTCYYRLKQTDLDGTVSYSPINALIIRNTTGLRASPNPVTGTVHISGASGKNIFLLNTEGQQVSVPKSYHTTTGEAVIDMSTLPSGIYYLKSESQTIKLIKK